MFNCMYKQKFREFFILIDRFKKCVHISLLLRFKICELPPCTSLDEIEKCTYFMPKNDQLEIQTDVDSSL
jgi:hypothetical protein